MHGGVEMRGELGQLPLGRLAIDPLAHRQRDRRENAGGEGGIGRRGT